MKKILIYTLTIFLLLATNNLFAQVRTNFNNTNEISDKGLFAKNYGSKIDFEVPAKNVNELLETEKRELSATNEIKSFKLALPIMIDLDIAKLIEWTTDADYAFGKYSIRIKGALSASINFDKFYLPSGTELYVYNETGEMITGPVTEKENNENKIWGSWVYRGQFLTIEVKTPLNTKSELILHSNNIAYGYKEIYKRVKVGGFGQSGPCNINVICPLGNGWEGERNTVSTILSANGSEFCTGSLVMNTCGTNAPYYLTANHCFEGNSNTSGWRFSFQAWSPTCPNPGINVNGVMYNGSTLRARNAASDFCLVELNTTPPANSGIHYAGWSRDATPAQNATTIHHPQGDVMKISRANNAVSVGSFAGTTNQHWQANWSPQINGVGQVVTPVTEVGSSGSPLFDQNHRIVGQLHGGPSACGATQLWDFYGRFDLSWTGGGTNATRLSNWLDPNNSGAIATNTTNVSNLIAPATQGSFLPIAGSNVVCGTSATYSITGVQQGAIVTWALYGPDANGHQLPLQNVCTLTPNGTQATLTKVNNGTVKLFATITYCGGIVQYATITVTFGVPELYSNAAYYNNYGYHPLDGTVSYVNSISTYITLESSYYNSYVWELASKSSNANWYTSNQNTYGFIWFNNPVYTYDYIGFSIHTTNACGTRTDPVYIYYDGPTQYYRVAPNPVKSTFSIDQVEINRNTAPTGKKQLNIDLLKIQIIDKMGNIALEKVYPANTKSATVNASYLKSDIYTVRLFTQDKVESHKIVVRH